MEKCKDLPPIEDLNLNQKVDKDKEEAEKDGQNKYVSDEKKNKDIHEEDDRMDSPKEDQNDDQKPDQGQNQNQALEQEQGEDLEQNQDNDVKGDQGEDLQQDQNKELRFRLKPGNKKIGGINNINKKIIKKKNRKVKKA